MSISWLLLARLSVLPRFSDRKILLEKCVETCFRLLDYFAVAESSFTAERPWTQNQL